MMKQDIRDLFKTEDNKILPENHRKEFLDKLKKQSPKPKPYLWLKVAVSIVIVIGIGYAIITSSTIENDTAPIISKVEAIESEYLEHINEEWQKFLVVAKDEKLVKRFERKLNDLDKDYQEISVQFKNDANNILVVEALIDNLQTRLQILKDIQHHIQLLNQKNEHYGKTI